MIRRPLFFHKGPSFRRRVIRLSARYAKEFLPLRLGTSWLGELRHITVTMAKTWERYGIHAPEAVYPITGPGYISARSMVAGDRHTAHFEHARGLSVTVAQAKDLASAFGCLQVAGTAGCWQGRFGSQAMRYASCGL